jgi:hypothetical protein
VESSLNNLPGQAEATPARSYHLFRGLAVVLAFLVGLIIGFIGLPWPTKDTKEDIEDVISSDTTQNFNQS